MTKPRSLLFVCTGNICRSPAAEGLMRHALKERGIFNDFTLDSAGVDSHHIGQAPDHRARSTGLKYGVNFEDLVARNVRHNDFYDFDIIFAMDQSHYDRLKMIAPADATAKIELYLPFSGTTMTREVPDPYYGSMDDFEHVHALLAKATEGVLNKIT